MSGAAGRRRLIVRIRRARLGDLSDLIHLYRDRSEESKRTYHPFPSGRFALATIYLWMIVEQRWMRFMIRFLPRRAATLLVAERLDADGVVGYGTIRLMSGLREEPIARFGYLVGDTYQGQGVGGQLIEAMVYAAKDLGIRRGGGTVLAKNVASTSLITHWGWSLHRGEADRGAPDQENLAAVGDLDEILERRRRGGSG